MKKADVAQSTPPTPGPALPPDRRARIIEAFAQALARDLRATGPWEEKSAPRAEHQATPIANPDQRRSRRGGNVRSRARPPTKSTTGRRRSVGPLCYGDNESPPARKARGERVDIVTPPTDRGPSARAREQQILNGGLSATEGSLAPNVQTRELGDGTRHSRVERHVGDRTLDEIDARHPDQRRHAHRQEHSRSSGVAPADPSAGRAHRDERAPRGAWSGQRVPHQLRRAAGADRERRRAIPRR